MNAVTRGRENPKKKFESPVRVLRSSPYPLETRMGLSGVGTIQPPRRVFYFLIDTRRTS